MGFRERRATREWERANDDLDAHIASQGDKPTTRYLYLQAAVNDAYDKIPARYRDPRDQEDDD